MEWPKSPISWIERRILHISIPFTWNLPEVRDRLLQKSFLWDVAFVGGPAVTLMPAFLKDIPNVTIGETMPGVLQRVNPQATRTTVGCPNACAFCGVKRINGGRPFRELDDWPDLPVVVDDNLFAASQNHFDRVIDRLIRWGWCDFNQGVDSRLLTAYHAERIAQIKKPTIRLALDSMGYADQWEKAFETLRQAGIAKSRIKSYALIGYGSDPAEAWQRCQWIESHRVDVLPMWYHALNALEKNIVTPQQIIWGWTEKEFRRIMTWYYQHREGRRMRSNNRMNRTSKGRGDNSSQPSSAVAAPLFAGYA